MGNVFIIGNGFDLDLGLPTKYSDFAKSAYWPDAAPKKLILNDRVQSNSGIFRINTTADAPKLEEVIETARNRETWFDLEKELLEYAMQYESGTSNYSHFSRETPNKVKNNVEYFNKLRNSLNEYILDIEKNHEVRTECMARYVLDAVAQNGNFGSIYSFNYTDLKSIAWKLHIEWEIKYTHLHGNVSDGSIILGVDETKLRKGYESFHKSSSRYYRSHDLYNSLAAAKEIVIFGLSFGSIDYSYFDRFLSS